MKMLLDMLGVADNARMYSNTKIGSDGNYGESNLQSEAGSQGVLFPPLSSSF